MKKIGIFFGSTNGTTEGIAKQIANKLGIAKTDIHNVAFTAPNDLTKYDVLLLGSSTWGAGDLQDDWFEFLPKVQKLDLTNKYVALFGCGDAVSFGDTFCNALGTIYHSLQKNGCRFIGAMPTENYTYDDSTAYIDGKFIGLPLDEMNEDDQTEARINAWIQQLKKDGIE